MPNGRQVYNAPLSDSKIRTIQILKKYDKTLDFPSTTVDVIQAAVSLVFAVDFLHSIQYISSATTKLVV